MFTQLTLENFKNFRDVSEREFGGWKVLGEESASNYRTLRQRCPELGRLEGQIEDWLETQ